MATSTSELNKKCCIKCNGAKSSGGLFTCDGCQKMFCGRHVGEHREELSLQLEHAMQEHDLIQQEFKQLKLDQSVFDKINLWEKESIIKIRKIAETARAELQQFHQTVNDRIKKECSELAENLRFAHESDDFSEPDLNKWNQILNDLRRQLASTTEVNITEDKQPYINLIKVQHDIHGSINASLQIDPTFKASQRLRRTLNQTSNSQRDDQKAESTSELRRSRKSSASTNNAQVSDCKQQ